MEPSKSPEGTAKRIIIIGPSGRSIARLRRALIRDLIQRQTTVLALAPDMRTEDAQALIALGCEAGSYILKPEKFSLFPGRIVVRALADRIKAWQPHGVLVFGIAIAPLAVKAARHAGVAKTVLIVSELGDRPPGLAFSRALKSADTIVAHNGDDHRILARSGFNGSAGKLIRVAGAGADLAALNGLAVPGLEQGVVFLMAARLDREKGAYDFCEAARILKGEGAAAQFLLAGPGGSGDGAMRPEELSKYADAVEFLGDATDLRAALQRAHVFVAPSHLEGMPHAVQQAMAAGRPVIVANVPGSRETVDEMVNGIAVAPRDPKALADAMRRVMRNKDVLPAMGRASRAKAERHYDATVVNAQLRAALGLS